MTTPRLRRRPLQALAETLAHFGREVLPAGETVLARDHELGVALRDAPVARWTGAPAPVRWPRHHRRRCRARASWPVCGGIRGTDEPGETSAWSLRPPFMNRLYPAETRLKEGANAHDSGQNRRECSLAAGGWRPVSALPGSITGWPLGCQPRRRRCDARLTARAAAERFGRVALRPRCRPRRNTPVIPGTTPRPARRPRARRAWPCRDRSRCWPRR